jgi:hypothetical protein
MLEEPLPMNQGREQDELLFVASPLLRGTEGVIFGTIARSFVAYPALRQKQFQRERLALVVSGLADEIQRHCGDETSQRCAAAY